MCYVATIERKSESCYADDDIERVFYKRMFRGKNTIYRGFGFKKKSFPVKKNPFLSLK